MYSTWLGGFSHGLGIPKGVTLSDDVSFSGDGGSLAPPQENIVEARTGECTSDANICSIAQIWSKSWIYPMFIEFSGMSWIDSFWFVSTWI